MLHPYWNALYFAWEWFLWLGMIFLVFSTVGNWIYTDRAHQRFDEGPGKDAIDILNQRYARGEITRDEVRLMKSEVSREERKV